MLHDFVSLGETAAYNVYRVYLKLPFAALGFAPHHTLQRLTGVY